MIKNSEPLSLAETKELITEQEETIKEIGEENERLDLVISYMKKFSKLSIEKSNKMKEELKALDLMQLKKRHIIKIIDLLPADAEDLHKILMGDSVSLDREEIDKILDIVKKNSK